MIVINNKDGVMEEVVMPVKEKKRSKLKEITINKYKKNETLMVAKQLSDYCDSDGKPKQGQLKLSKLGVMYRLKCFTLTPLIFYLGVAGFSLILGVINFLISGSTIISIATPIFAFLGILVVFSELNKSDNKAILSDICNIYTILNIDMSNGKYISDCLIHIENVVINTRLKLAFNELIQNLQNRSTTIDESLVLFSNRFNSKELEKLNGYMSGLIRNGIKSSDIKKISYESGAIISDINKGFDKKTKGHINIIINTFTLIIIAIAIYFFVFNANALLKYIITI